MGEGVGPADIRSATWSAGRDWALAAAGAAVVVVAIIAVAPTEAVPPMLLVVPLAAIFSPLYLVAWWRARRLLPGLDAVHAGAGADHLDVVVRSSRSLGAILFSWKNGRLMIANGWVVLDGVTREAWPTGSVTIGRSPSWWVGRGVELVTPSGTRNVSLVPTWDPAVYFATVVDGPTRDLVAAALSRQRDRYPSVSPGWYPDPAGTAAWRWWDGFAWTGATA